jgi:hypothetical protein
VAVGAPHGTLLYFLQDAFPAASIVHHPRDGIHLSIFAIVVVELHDYGVSFTARAGVLQ